MELFLWRYRRWAVSSKQIVAEKVGPNLLVDFHNVNVDRFLVRRPFLEDRADLLLDGREFFFVHDIAHVVPGGVNGQVGSVSERSHDEDEEDDLTGVAGFWSGRLSFWRERKEQRLGLAWLGRVLCRGTRGAFVCVGVYLTCLDLCWYSLSVQDRERGRVGGREEKEKETAVGCAWSYFAFVRLLVSEAVQAKVVVLDS